MSAVRQTRVANSAQGQSSLSSSSLTSRKPGKRQQLLVKWLWLSIAVLVLLGAVILLVQYEATPRPGDDVEGLTSVLTRNSTADMASFQFDDVRQAAGIDFHHFPVQRQSLLPEDMGSGLAWGDYDGDGYVDLFLTNFGGSIQTSSSIPGRSALYRNTGDGTFVDVTEVQGLSQPTYGMSASWADYDNDGDLDLYLCNYGQNILYRNDAGWFVDVTDQAGVPAETFSAGSAWGDYNHDGHVDLYVTSYVDFQYRESDAEQVTRHYGSETPFTLNPSTYSPLTNYLYHNNGDGTFTDVAPGTPLENPEGRSLGAVWFDFDQDGQLDLYVANDVSDNGVFHNLGNGEFADIGPSSLAADYRGAMGMAVADYDRDDDLDLFVTHWLAQENAFFENMYSENWKDKEGKRRLFFMDSAEMIGLGQISLKMVGWSTGFADFDNDSLLDLWVVNGNTLEDAEDNSRLKAQQVQLFRQQEGKGFFEVGQQASSALAEPVVGRGGAHADYDGDGRVDVAILVHGGQPLLLRNVTKGDNHWFTLRLRQTGGNTHALGAKVWLRSGGVTQMAQLGADGAYLSQSDTDLHFGLGQNALVDELTILWPDGFQEKHTGLNADQIVALRHVANYPDF
jgi:enediyne biosynthesis protein E4